MIITGYKYTNEQDAINAREQCDAYYGIPVSPDDVTQNWIDYNTATLDLGEPSTFEVTVPNPF